MGGFELSKRKRGKKGRLSLSVDASLRYRSSGFGGERHSYVWYYLIAQTFAFVLVLRLVFLRGRPSLFVFNLGSFCSEIIPAPVHEVNNGSKVNVLCLVFKLGKNKNNSNFLFLLAYEN
jgi:hypothetical protein